MPIGTLSNCLAVFTGGLLGTALKRVIPEKLKSDIPVIFGLCSMGIGINSLVKASSMTPVVLAVLGVGAAVAPFLTPVMFADFTACGGVLTVAASLRVAKIKNIAIIDMMPALILVMPFSALWTALMG